MAMNKPLNWSVCSKYCAAHQSAAPSLSIKRKDWACSGSSTFPTTAPAPRWLKAWLSLKTAQIPHRPCPRLPQRLADLRVPAASHFPVDFNRADSATATCSLAQTLRRLNAGPQTTFGWLFYWWRWASQGRAWVARCAQRRQPFVHFTQAYCANSQSLLYGAARGFTHVDELDCQGCALHACAMHGVFQGVGWRVHDESIAQCDN